MGKKKKQKAWHIGPGEINRIGSIGLPSTSIQGQSPPDSGVPEVLHINGPGIYFGAAAPTDIGGYIGMRQGADGNLAVFGGSGSGKSRGIAMPTLQTYRCPICATDIKGELTSHYKALYLLGEVTDPFIEFDPTDEETASYDPFGCLPTDNEADRVEGVERIAYAIIPDRPNANEPFWDDAERRILAASLLHYHKLGLSFPESVCKIMELPVSSLCEKLAESCDTSVKMILGEGAKLKPETLACIDQGLRNNLRSFTLDPYVSHALRGQREGARCFTWEHLERNHIFLKIPEDRIDSWGRMLNLMYSQLFHHLMRRPEKYRQESTPVLLLLDEFPRLGKIEGIAEIISTLRSKNVNICLIMQSVAQLDKIYGPIDRRIILDNCSYQAVLRANDSETQRYLADLIGTRQHLQHGVSEQLNRFMDPVSYSRQISESRDWAIYPHELSTLEDILLLTPYGFCRTKKTLSQLPLKLELSLDKDVKTAPTSDPPNAPGEPAMRNPGARMLTIEERLANANRHAAEAKYQQSFQEDVIN